MTDLKWEQPPPPSAQGGHNNLRYNEIAEALKSKPGEWARIAEYKHRQQSSIMAMKIRNGDAARWRPAGDFDAVGRAVDGKFYVYARYIGVSKG